MNKILELNPNKGNGGKDIGVEYEVVIQRFTNGTVAVKAETLSAKQVRSLLMEALLEIQQDISVNIALGLVAAYLDNLEKQKKIVESLGKPH